MGATSEQAIASPRTWPVPAPVVTALAAGAAVLATQVTGAVDGPTYRAAFMAVAAVALVLIVIGGWRARNQIGAVASLLVAVMGLFIVADAGWTTNAVILHISPWPAWTDAVFLTGYVPLMATALLVVHRQQAGRDVGALLDALVVTVGIGVLAYAFVIGNVLLDSSSTPLERVVGSLHPLADVLVAGVVMRLLVTAGGRQGAVPYLAAAMLCLLGGDLLFIAAVFDGAQDTSSRWGDSCYLMYYLFLAMMTWHPQIGRLTLQREDRGERMGPVRTAALTVGAMLAPITLLLQNLTGRTVDVRGEVIGSIVLFGLVLARMWLLIREVEQQRELQALQARTDALTGLANRRTFDHELDRAMVWATAGGRLAPICSA